MNKILAVLLALVMFCGGAVLFITNRVLDENLDAMTRAIESADSIYGKTGTQSAPDRRVGDEFRKVLESEF